jgi:hypothetical protein
MRMVAISLSPRISAWASFACWLCSVAAAVAICLYE